MPLPIFELSCIVVLVLAFIAMARIRPLVDLLVEYSALVLAGFLGEESCVVFYEYYHYADGYHGRIDRVPVLVPLIWPLVILSAREVGRALWPRVTWARPILVGAIVAFDASLVEVVAVRAGLWSWVEEGHLHVPVLGILGWGYFAIGADIALSEALPWGRKSKLALALQTIVLAPLTAHALILATWWGFFRYAQRHALGNASLVGLGVIGLVVLGFVLQARLQGRTIPFKVSLPRLCAASLFFVLLLLTAPTEWPYWFHTAIVAVPYFVASELWPRAK